MLSSVSVCEPLQADDVQCRNARPDRRSVTASASAFHCPFGRALQLPRWATFGAWLGLGVELSTWNELWKYFAHVVTTLHIVLSRAKTMFPGGTFSGGHGNLGRTMSAEKGGAPPLGDMSV